MVDLTTSRLKRNRTVQPSRDVNRGTFQNPRSPGKRRRWQLSTDNNGVGVWPNTFTWTWVESGQVKVKVKHLAFITKNKTKDT